MRQIRSRFLLVASILIGLSADAGRVMAQTTVRAHRIHAVHSSTRASAVREVTLNGLKISIDKTHGTIVGLEYPGPGKILSARAEQSGLVDVAYPIPEFEPLRMASEYATGVQIAVTDSVVTIHWDSLGSSRSFFHPQGRVSATVKIEALPDGQSISLNCTIDNQSDRAIGQILFPDLHGLLPVDGRAGTTLRTCGFVSDPFQDVGITLYPEFYALDQKTRPADTRDTYVYQGGRAIDNGDEMIGRWLDYGGLNGGFSLFPKRWFPDRATLVRIFRLEKDPKVRLAQVHNDSVKAGQHWKSPEYILTPHRNGWAKGIKPYKDFVATHVHRMFPMPAHIKDGLGFRTVIMGTRYPADTESDASFRFTDLPSLARECKENGLTEMVIWAWRRSFLLPGIPPYANLGTSQELTDAIKACHRIGVNVSLFESVVSLSNPTAAAYGRKVGLKGWTYHPELIPRFNPYYATGMATVTAHTSNPRWQKDVVKDVKMIYDTYTHSITWDQGYTSTDPVYKKFLPLVKKTDPEASFSAEITGSAECMANYLDYTWNWQLGSYFHNGMKEYRDLRGFTAAFPAPRLNYNINRNAQDIKYAFLDNQFVNLMPSSPDGANGTARLSDYPELGIVLKQCAGLRKQFLNYFTEGQLIGECLLKKGCPGAHVSAYVLADRVLFFVMNTSGQPRQIPFTVDLKPWLSTENKSYQAITYGPYGKPTGSVKSIDAEWSSQTRQLRNMDFAIYEFKAR